MPKPERLWYAVSEFWLPLQAGTPYINGTLVQVHNFLRSENYYRKREGKELLTAKIVDDNIALAAPRTMTWVLPRGHMRVD